LNSLQSQLTQCDFEREMITTKQNDDTAFARMSCVVERNQLRIDADQQILSKKLYVLARKLTTPVYKRRHLRLTYVIPFVERQLPSLEALIVNRWRRLPPCNASMRLYDDVSLAFYPNRVLGTTARDHELNCDRLRTALVGGEHHHLACDA
jgi:hypothetical protein